MNIKNTKQIDNQEIISIINEFLNSKFIRNEERDFNPSTDVFNHQEVQNKIELPPITDQGSDIKDSIDAEIGAIEHDANVGHPRYYGLIPGPAHVTSWLGDFIATAYNSHVGIWRLAPAVSAMEKAVVDWALNLVGFSKYKHAGGILESGGTMAGFTAIAAARDAKIKLHDLQKAVVYISDQTHTANHKAFHLVGIPEENWRIIATKNYQMITSELKKQIQKDLENGFLPFLVVGTCGTTNTGSIDPLDEIADICEEFNLWFHVDASYGGSIVLSNEKHRAKGMHRADSIAWDAHKWLYQIYGVAFCLVKDRRHLQRTYTVGGEYLQDVEQSGVEPDWWDLGPELTRPPRAPRIWLTLHTLGNNKLSEMINTSIKHAKWLEQQIISCPKLELISPASLAIVTFRIKGENDQQIKERNIKVSEKLRKEKVAGIFTTELNGKNVLRICTISPKETSEDLSAMFTTFLKTLDEMGY